jgi:RNA polymerase sigma factor (sigma-70 family)
MNPYDDALDQMYRVSYRVAYRMLGSHDDAEDVAQEVCARALIRWSKIENYAEAWAARSAGNLVLDGFRRTARSMPVLAPEEASVDSERVELVRALRLLPRRQREVVVLRYLADLSEQDVATKLGCSLGTVKQHAHRGLSTLRADGNLTIQKG